MIVDNLTCKGHFCFFNRRENHTFTFTTSFFSRQVVVSNHHILRWGNDWLSILWRQNVACGKHQQTCFCLRFIRQWHVNGHLITIEIGVIGFSNQWMQTHGLTRNQHRFKGLDSQTVQRRGAVQKNWVFLDHVFQYVHHIFISLVNLTLSRLDVTG